MAQQDWRLAEPLNARRREAGTVVDAWSLEGGQIREKVVALPDGTYWRLDDFDTTKPAVQVENKGCPCCRAPVVWKAHLWGGATRPYDLDFSPHTCERRSGFDEWCGLRVGDSVEVGGQTGKILLITNVYGEPRVQVQWRNGERAFMRLSEIQKGGKDQWTAETGF